MRIALQAAVLYASAMNHLFHTVVLPLAALASTVLWAEELRNLIVRAMRRAVR